MTQQRVRVKTAVKPRKTNVGRKANKYRRSMERVPAAIVKQRRLKKAATQAKRAEKIRTEQQQLKATDPVIFESLQAEKRLKATLQKALYRKKQKRPTEKQAIKLIDQCYEIVLNKLATTTVKTITTITKQQSKSKRRAAKLTNADDSRRANKYGEILPSLAIDIIKHANIDANSIVVDVGGGEGKLANLIALLTGARVHSIELNSKRARFAQLLTKEVRKQCVKKGYNGVGVVHSHEGDALDIMAQPTETAQSHWFLEKVDDSTSTTTTSKTNRRQHQQQQEEVKTIIQPLTIDDDDNNLTLYQKANRLIFNNYAFPDVVAQQVIESYGAMAPTDGTICFLRNCAPRARIGTGSLAKPYEDYRLVPGDEIVHSIPKDSITWRSSDGVHYALLRVNDVGKTNDSSSSTAKQNQRRWPAEMISMSPSIMI